MKAGSCLTSEYGSLGCSVDILPQLDQMCSGRATCTLNIRDLVTYNPCPKDLRGYLEVKYTCIVVKNPVHSTKDKNVCRGDNSSPTDILVSTTTDATTTFTWGTTASVTYSGILSNYITDVTNCGGLEHPWSIRGYPGQRINVTIMDFSGLAANSHDEKNWKNSGLCLVYANVKDRMIGTTETLCADGPRLRHAYLSISHHVEIRFMVRSNKAESMNYALLYYHVVGCPETLESQTGGRRRFKKLSSERAVFSCQDSQEVYELTCVVNEWKGSDVNCSSGGFPFPSGFLTGKHLTVEGKIILTIIVTCLIGVIVLVGGILIVKRKMSNRLNHGEQNLSRDEMIRQVQLRQHQQQLIYAQKLQTYDTTSHLPTIKSQPNQPIHQSYAFDHSPIDCYFRQPGMPSVPSSVGAGSVPPVRSMPSKPAVLALQGGSIDDSYNKLISDHIYESPNSVKKEIERLTDGSNERDKLMPGSLQQTA